MSNKRNPKGDGSVRERSNGRWEARITVGYDPGTGKQIRRSIYGATQKEVLQKKREILKSVDDGTYLEPSKMTVGAWLDIWLAEYMADKKYNTVKHYKAQCKEHIKPAFGALKLSALKPHDIQKFYNVLQTGAGDKKSLAPKSIRNLHGIFHKALSTAVSIGYLRQNPADVLTLPKVVRKEMQPLTDAQVNAFIEAVDGSDYATLFKVLLFTGMRKGEALGLTWDSVNYEAGTITVNKQLQRQTLQEGGVVFAPPKNDKSRTLSPAPFVMRLLKSHEAKQKEMRLKAGIAWEGWTNEHERKTGLVFTNALGRHNAHETIYKTFKRIVPKIGTPDATVHDLRHTYAVISLQSGDDIKTLQENLGHHSVAFTLDLYGHVSEKMRQNSADRMETYIKDVQNL